MIKNCDIVLSLQHLFLEWIIKDLMKVIRHVWILQSDSDGHNVALDQSMANY